MTDSKSPNYLRFKHENFHAQIVIGHEVTLCAIELL